MPTPSPIRRWKAESVKGQQQIGEDAKRESADQAARERDHPKGELGFPDCYRVVQRFDAFS
jgi:hypothetical protein